MLGIGPQGPHVIHYSTSFAECLSPKGRLEVYSFEQKIDIDNMLVTGICKQANSGHLSKLTSFADHPTPQDTQWCLSIVNKHQNLRRAYKTQIAGALPLLSDSAGPQ